MAITVRHGDISTVAALATKAGAAKALEKAQQIQLKREALENTLEQTRMREAGAYARQMASLKAAAEGRTAATEQAYTLEQMRQAGQLAELDYRNQLAIEAEQRQREAKREAQKTWTPYQKQMRTELQADMQKIMDSDDLTLEQKEYGINLIQEKLNSMIKLADGPPLPEDILDERLVEKNGHSYLLDSKGNFKDVTPDGVTAKDASNFLRSAREQLRAELEEGQAEPTEDDIMNRAAQLYRMNKKFQQRMSSFEAGVEPQIEPAVTPAEPKPTVTELADFARAKSNEIVRELKRDLQNKGLDKKSIKKTVNAVERIIEKGTNEEIAAMLERLERL